jgi:alpha-L-rhamnosidase
VRGTVLSSWQRNGNTLTYHARVPVGTTATIQLPLLGGLGSTVRESGRTIFTAGQPAQSDPGLSVGNATDQALTLTAGSGDYTFTVTPPATSFASLTMTAGASGPITVGTGGDLNAVVEGRSTTGGSAVLGAQTPAGWTVTATPAQVPLTPATTADLRVTVPAGTSSGVYPVTVTATAPDGTIGRSVVDVDVFGSWPSGTSASASSEHAPNTVNGVVRTYYAVNAIDGNFATFWNNANQFQYPDTLTVTPPAAMTLTGVGFASFADGVPTDFTVQTQNGSTWVTQAAISGNSAVYRWIPFASPVTTGQVRVVVTGTQDGFTRIAELTP